MIDIIECLKNDYGIDIAGLVRLPLGADMSASVYKATTHDQKAYFIKLKKGHHQDMSSLVLPLLENAGIKEIIPIIKTINGESTQNIDGYTLQVSPYIKGENGFQRSLTEEQWQKFGKVMRQIHELDVKLKIRHETFSPKWREIVRSILTRIETEKPVDDVAHQLINFMKSKRNVIHQLVDSAEQLASKIKEKDLKLVLCHSDIHGGNVLLDRDDLYIVDWDNPIMAPRERDLMFIGGGVENVWNKPKEVALFYKGYGKTEIDREILAYYRHERIVEDIAEYSQQLILSNDGGNSRQESYNHFIAKFETNGVVEIAFNT